MRRGGGRCKDRRGSAKRGGAILTRTLLLALDSVNKRNKLIPRFTANCFTTVYGYDVTYSASLTLTPSLSLSLSVPHHPSIVPSFSLSFKVQAERERN